MGKIFWVSTELVTKKSPPVLDTEILESFLSTSVFILVGLNLLALSLLVLNFSFPHWNELLTNWWKRRKQEDKEALPKASSPAPSKEEMSPAPTQAPETLPPPPPMEAEAANPAEVINSSEPLESSEAPEPTELVEPAESSEPTELTESIVEASRPTEVSEPTEVGEPVESPEPASNPLETMAESPTPPSESQGEPQAEAPAEPETEAAPEIPEIEEEYIPPPPPEDLPLPEDQDSTENLDSPEDLGAKPEIDAEPEAQGVFEEKTEVYTKDEAPSSPTLPRSDESDETTTEQMKAPSKTSLDDKLEDILNSPIEETEEIPIFDTSLLDQEIQLKKGQAKKDNV